MQVQINTDHSIAGREGLATHVNEVVKNALKRFRDRVTRVEVHLGDETGQKSGKIEKRCVMEARLQGRPPVAVTHHAASLHQAIEGAAEKLAKLVESTIGRLRDQRSRAPEPPPQQE